MLNRINKIDPNWQRMVLLFALPILYAIPPQAQAADPVAVDVLQVRAYCQQELQAVVSGFAVNGWTRG